MPNPEPVTVQVCDTCGQPWSAHLRLARSRALQARWDEDDEPTGVVLPEDVTLEDCVALLKTANQGPPGPQGPMGMTGPGWRPIS